MSQGPATAADMRRDRIDIRGLHVRLDLVAFDLLRRARMVDRIDQREEFGGLIARAEISAAALDEGLTPDERNTRLGCRRRSR